MLNKVHNSTKYVNIPDDCLDTRIPLFSDDAFRQGIVYEAKYIGSMDVARPQNRLEIVSAMRRIRFEFKAKAVKKERIFFKISTDGVFVNLRTKKKTPIKLRLSQSFNLLNTPIQDNPSSSALSSTPGLLLMHHPIYRIFYVSHDSQDLKIFSYIARDSKSTNFKCNVFKALRKMEAMKIVRTVGQAFDVCHRLSQLKNEETKSNSDCNGAATDNGNQEESTTGSIGGTKQSSKQKNKTASNSSEVDEDVDGSNTMDDKNNNNNNNNNKTNNNKGSKINNCSDTNGKTNENKKATTSSGNILQASQSAQPIRSADLIKIDDDDDDENQSDSQSESLSTLDDLLSTNFTDKKLATLVPNSISEPSIKSHITNGHSGTDEKRSTFDSFLSSYLLLNYIISKQLSNLSISGSPPLSSASSVFDTIKEEMEKMGIPGVDNVLNSHTESSLPGRVSATQLQLLKSQLEEEIIFRIKCQTQINRLSSQNRQLSTFIRRTFEEVRHNQCESCMLRLSALDITAPQLSTSASALTAAAATTAAILSTPIAATPVTSSSSSVSLSTAATTVTTTAAQASLTVLPPTLTKEVSTSYLLQHQRLHQIQPILPPSLPPPSSSSTTMPSSLSSVSIGGGGGGGCSGGSSIAYDLHWRQSSIRPSTSQFNVTPSSNTNMHFDCLTKSNTVTESFFGKQYSNVILDEKDPFKEENEKEVSFEDINFYRKVDDSVQRNFYKMATWDKSETPFDFQNELTTSKVIDTN